MSTSSVSGSNSASSSSATSVSTDRFAALDTSDFLNLFVAELQNQDPLNPMDNSQMLQQMSNIQAIQSNKKLSETLASMQLGQAMTTASTLLGKQISALDTNSKTVSGVVDSVTVTDGEVRLHVGDSEVSLTNVKEVQAAVADSTTTADLLSSLLNSAS